MLLLSPNGGLAQMEELCFDRNAFATAAGHAGERLAEQFAAPEYPVNDPGELTVDEIKALPLFKSAPRMACQLGRYDDREAGPTDHWAVAMWAINGREDDPESWAGRVDVARRRAAEIVERNAAAIVRVARALYIAGSLGEQEILDHMNGVSDV